MKELGDFSLFNIIDKISLRNTINKNLDDVSKVVFDNFHLLESNRNNINLDNIQNCEESHNKLFPKNLFKKNDLFSYHDDSDIELINKKNFFNDSFFEQVLSNAELKESFEKINSNKDFKIKLNGERTNSSQFSFYSIIQELNNKGKIDEIKDNLNKQIKSLTPLQKENIAIISNIYQVPDNIKSIKYYRTVKQNGDSFYISFIYQYMKNLIIEGDYSIISRIINLDRDFHLLNNEQEKDEKPIAENELGNEYINNAVSYNIQNDNIVKAFAYLAIIYTLITQEKNRYEYGFKMFNLAFAYDIIFSKLLVFFVKVQIKKFLHDNYDKFKPDKYCKESNLINEKFFDNEKFNYELYINENLFIEQMEPSLFIISIIPYVFNISLNLYVNEGNLITPNGDKLTKIEINPNDENMDINILYSSYSYHIIENELNEDDLEINTKKKFDICNIFNDMEYNTEYNIKIKEYKNDYITEITKEKCKKCNKTDYIKIKNYNDKNTTCLNCFKTMVNNILIKRYQHMLNEKFKFVEFYLKEITLIRDDNSNSCINLSSTEFFYIFNENLFTYFRNLIRGICDLCGKYFKDKKIINKKCGCKRCIECAKFECKIIYFNNFEKNYVYKNDFIKCKCGKDIEKKQYASQIYNMITGDEKMICEKKAKERIKDCFLFYCVGCGKKFEIEDINKVINLENIEHKFCEDCYNIIKTSKIILCVICNEEHIFKEGLNKSKKSIKIKKTITKESMEEKQEKNIDINIDINQQKIELKKSSNKKEKNEIKNSEILLTNKDDEEKENIINIENDSKNVKDLDIKPQEKKTKKIIIVENDEKDNEKEKEKDKENKNSEEEKENKENTNSDKTNSKIDNPQNEGAGPYKGEDKGGEKISCCIIY